MKTNQNFVLREIYGKSILMPIRVNHVSNDPVFLNSTATMIWKNVESCMKKEDLVKKICEIFELSIGSAEEKAIQYFIDHLSKMELIYEN